MMSAPSPTPPTRHHLLHSHHNSHHPHHSSASNTIISNNASTNNSASSSPASNNLDSLEDKHSLKMKIKRTKPPTKTSEAKHEIVKPLESDTSDGAALNHNQVPHNAVVNASSNIHLSMNSGSQVEANGSSHGIPRQNVVKHNHKKEKRRHEVNGSVQPMGSQQQTPLHSSNSQKNSQQQLQQQIPPLSSTTTPALGPLSGTCLKQQCVTPVKSGNAATASTASSIQHATPLRSDTLPPAKRLKIGEEQSASGKGGGYCGPGRGSSPNGGAPVSYKDVCVGTSVATITEPDCLGPCEPGSSVTLEGIVWHETQGGVLVVNVTWRGKSYVGTLLDCTQHDWAPPRLCDSPSTEDMDSRTPKGRGKRGRQGAGVQTSQAGGSAGSGGGSGTNNNGQSIGNLSSANDFSNVTETRSGKVRGNQPQKGRRGAHNNNFATPNSPQTGPNSKRKGRDVDTPNSNDTKSKRSRMSGKQSDTAPNSPESTTASGIVADESCPLTVSSPAQSPQYIECPQPNCSKKYKHLNGLKYHQNHAHNNADEENSNQAEAEESSNTVTPADDGRSENASTSEVSDETPSKATSSNSTTDSNNSTFNNFSNRSSPSLNSAAGADTTRDSLPPSRLPGTPNSQASSLEEQQQLQQAHQAEKFDQFSHGKPPLYQQRIMPHNLISTQPSPYHPPPHAEGGPLVSEQAYSPMSTIYSHTNAGTGFAISSNSTNNHPSSPIPNSSGGPTDALHSPVIARLPPPNHPMYYYPPNSAAMGLVRPGISQTTPAGAVRPPAVVRTSAIGNVPSRQPAPHIISNTPTSLTNSPRPALMMPTPPPTAHMSSLPGSPLVKNGSNKNNRESGEDEDPRSPAYSDISDAADAPPEGDASSANSADRKDSTGKPDPLLMQAAPPSYVGLGVYGGFDSSFPGHSPYLLRYNANHPLGKPESKEGGKPGEEKKENSDNPSFPAAQNSFPSGMYPYAGGLAPPPHYTSDPYYAHLAHSVPPSATSVDVSHPSSKEGSGAPPVGGVPPPKLPAPGPYPATPLDPRLLHPLLSAGLPIPVGLPHSVDKSHSNEQDAGPLSLENKIDTSTESDKNRDVAPPSDAPSSSSGSSFNQS